MKLREAAQQALEALELAQTDVHWELNSPTRKFLRKAEKALRAALAEPVQEPQRKPLTDEEIVVLFNKLVQDRPAWPERRYRDFARYVERAHGIGDKNGE